jgi:hypothetical protein
MITDPRVLARPNATAPATDAQDGSDSPAVLLDSRRLALALLLIFASVFLLQAAPRIAAPFGDSHDGENGAVWGFASRAIRNDGFFGSRGGARLGAGEGTYAHHPPLIANETALVESVFGHRPTWTRLPAWLASLATIPLLYLLLVALGIRRVPSALGTILALATPMFLLYGSMLDTLQISLPFAVAFLLVRARGDVQRRPIAPCIPFALAIVLVLGSWEGALLCGVYAAADLVRGWRERHRIGLSATSAGFLVGVITLAAWLWWVAGSFDPIFDQARMRSGSGSAAIGWSSFLEFQGIYLGALIGPVVLLAGIIGLGLVLRNRSARLTVFGIVGVTLAYPVLLRDGASNHDYWNYWIVIPLALGAGCTVQCLWCWVARRYDSEPLALGVALTVCGICLALALTAATPAREQFDAGVSAAHLLRTAQDEHPGVAIAIVDRVSGGDIRWADYSLTPRPRRLHTVDQIKREALRRPNAPVLVKCVGRTAVLDRICATSGRHPYMVTDAAHLAGSIGG